MSLPEPIYEFGAPEVPGQEQRAIRPLFAGRDYLGCDLEPGPGVDRTLDLERLAAGRLWRALRHWSRHESQGVAEWLTLLLPPIVLAPAYRWFTRFTAWRRRRSRT